MKIWAAKCSPNFFAKFSCSPRRVARYKCFVTTKPWRKDKFILPAQVKSFEGTHAAMLRGVNFAEEIAKTLGK